MSQGSMSERALGADGLKVSAIGLGCMGMSEFYDSKQMDDAESIKVIHRYFDAGGNFLDTADMYGSGRNETLVGRAIAGRRGQVILKPGCPHRAVDVRGARPDRRDLTRRPSLG